ncbi:putative reverse transcriptase domain-containing protein [Tanacetum coccineum]|uniref:Reverse transcriptase domain-containing protein n=1 Tax=Tanacetum coccineum TaxID=301880 RepID=A0ABQ5EU72_9ASTR
MKNVTAWAGPVDANVFGTSDGVVVARRVWAGAMAQPHPALLDFQLERRQRLPTFKEHHLESKGDHTLLTFTMAGVDINTLTMHAPAVVKPEIGGNVYFEIKSQFMRELREDTFSGNKDEDAHDHIDRVLSIVGLFNVLEVSKDAVMLQIFPFTLIEAAKRWGPIPGMRPAEALTAIQTMAGHSQKWHNGTTSKKMGSENSSDGLAALVNKLDNLGRDMKKLKESVHAIQVGCQICEGPHLDKDCPLNEEVKQVEEIKKLQENAKINTRNQIASLKNLEAQIEQLTKEIRSNKALKQVKTITVDQETFGLNKLHGVSFISDPESKTAEVLQHQLPRKELNPGNFTLPYTIDKFNFYDMADLGSSINVMPRSIFEHLKLTNLRKTNMLCEMADMSKKGPLGIVENVLVKIGKFLFLSDFVIIDNTPLEITILGRPFLATIHAEINVFTGKISLGINENRISFNSMRNNNKHTNLSERIFMVRPHSPAHRINKFADEYELGIGKKGHTLDHIWEYCNQVHNKNYEWHNYEFKNEECEEIGIEDKDYHPPKVQVETFEVKKYSFNGGQSFICVTKDLDNTLPLGRKNGSKFKEMI